VNPNWQKTGAGMDYLVTPGGFAYLHPWANPGFTCGVIYHQDGRVDVVPHQDHHRPFEGIKYDCSLGRAKAVCESLLRRTPVTDAPDVYDRLLGEDPDDI
jgi:hypothetical protein